MSRLSVALLATMLGACGGDAAAPLGGAPVAAPVLCIVGDSHAALWARLGQIYPGWRTAYFGVPGETSAAVAARFAPAGVCTTVVLLVGTNDLVLDPAASVRNVETMAANARAAGVRVVLWTLPPIRAVERDVGPWNRAIRALGYPVLEGNAAADYLSADGVHLTTAGYQRLSVDLYSLIGG